MHQPSLRTFLSGCNKEMWTQLLGSCAYMATAQERQHQINICLRDTHDLHFFFFLSETPTEECSGVCLICMRAHLFVCYFSVILEQAV